MGEIIIYSDIVSVVFLIILLCGSLYGAKDKSRSTLFFRLCIVAAVIGTVADAVSYLTFDSLQFDALLVAANTISYAMTPVMFILFTFYFFAVIETKATVPRWGVYPAVVIAAMDIVMVVIGAMNKKMTYMENGEVFDGEWTDYTSILMFLGILYLYYVLVSYRKALSVGQLLAFGGFLFFPILDSWITLFSAGTDFTYPVVALAFVIIYVIIQEQAVAEESRRRILFEEDSLTDPLTGFKNRRAYDEIVKSVERGRANGVVYCSVNHLDEIRQKDGPEAADKYVVGFDGILKSGFPGADIYRVSENGFAVLLYKISEETLQKRVNSFSQAMEENDGMASFGYVYSDTAPLFDMVRDAQSI